MQARSQETARCVQVSEEAKNLIKRLLRATPSERMTLDAIEAHPWLQKYAHTVAPRSEYRPD